jgi:hypothetical protein
MMVAEIPRISAPPIAPPIIGPRFEFFEGIASVFAEVLWLSDGPSDTVEKVITVEAPTRVCVSVVPAVGVTVAKIADACPFAAVTILDTTEISGIVVGSATLFKGYPAVVQ